MTAPAVFGVTKTDFAARAAAKTDASVLGRSALGKEDFLNILVAQLKNQDPMSPMEGTEFATQLAQFSNVEQLINISGKMDAQTAAATQTQLNSQTALGASLIGRQVSFETNTMTFTKGTDAVLHFSLSAVPSDAKVEVFNAKGETVYEDKLTDLVKGDQKVTIDSSKLPTGDYTYKVSAVDAEKKDIGVVEYGTGVVDGISFDNGQIVLHFGNHTVPLLQISEILAPPAAATGDDNSTKESSLK